MNRRTSFLVAISVLSLSAAAIASPVGMAVKVSGSPSVKSGGAQKALRNTQQLEPGDVISCGAGESAVIVLFRSGERFQVNAGGRGTVREGVVAGAQSLGKLGGPSARVSQQLGNSRTGAVMGRNVGRHQRLNQESRGYMTLGERHFDWTPITGAEVYTFSLFDRFGNVIWSTRTTVPSADYPADMPALEVQRPYIWRLSGFKDSGKPMPQTRWGVMTWLSPEDRKDVDATYDESRKQIEANKDDPEAVTALRQQLAVLYSNYGVYQLTLDILSRLDDAGIAGAGADYDAACAQIGDYATFLNGSKPAAPADLPAQ